MIHDTDTCKTVHIKIVFGLNKNYLRNLELSFKCP